MLGIVAASCAMLLLAGCVRPAPGGATPTRVGATPPVVRAASPVVGASHATPATQAAAPLRVSNASVTPPPWQATPVVATALAVTPTPRVCPTPDPPFATANANAGGTCQQIMLFPPLAPTFVAVVAVDGAIEVQWHATGSGTHYEVYRQVAPRGAWAHLASVAVIPSREPPINPDGATPYAWRDTTAVAGTTYRYAVDKVSAYGVPSGDAQASPPITAP